MSASEAIRKYNFDILGIEFGTFFVAIGPGIFAVLAFIIHVGGSLILPFLGVYTLLGIIAYVVFVVPAQKEWFKWAFTHVDSVHELNIATAQRLLINVGQQLSLLETSDPEAARYIKDRFENDPVSYDDPRLHKEYKIRRHRRSKFYIIASVPIFLIFLQSDFFDLRGLTALLCLCLFILGNVLMLLDQKVKVVINEFGITMGGGEFVPWSDISLEQVECKRMGMKKYNYYLSFYAKDIYCLFLIDYLEYSVEEIRHMLVVFRYRHEHLPRSEGNEVSLQA